MKTARSLAAVAALCGIAAVVSAQPPPSTPPVAAAAEPADGPGRRAAPADAARSIDPARLRAAERELARRDPPIARVVGAALEMGASDPEGADDLASRARLSGLVPSLRAGVRRGQGQDLSLQVTDEDAARFSTDDDLSVYGTLTFDLGRLVFAREEVSLAREGRQRHAERRELVATVVALYYERRRLLLERALLGPGDLEHAVRIAELTALLNAFTDGAFSRMMSPAR